MDNSLSANKISYCLVVPVPDVDDGTPPWFWHPKTFIADKESKTNNQFCASALSISLHFIKLTLPVKESNWTKKQKKTTTINNVFSSYGGRLLIDVPVHQCQQHANVHKLWRPRQTSTHAVIVYIECGFPYMHTEE